MLIQDLGTTEHTDMVMEPASRGEPLQQVREDGSYRRKMLKECSSRLSPLCTTVTKMAEFTEV
jgi:hypothetical protein